MTREAVEVLLEMLEDKSHWGYLCSDDIPNHMTLSLGSARDEKTIFAVRDRIIEALRFTRQAETAPATMECLKKAGGVSANDANSVLVFLIQRYEKQLKDILNKSGSYPDEINSTTESKYDTLNYVIRDLEFMKND